MKVSITDKTLIYNFSVSTSNTFYEKLKKVLLVDTEKL